MRPMLSINGHNIPEPSTYNATTSDTVDGARNTEAVFIGAVIRSDMAKVDANWNYISAENWAYILKLFNPKYGGSFVNSVTFFNQVTNDWETRDMYPSDRTAGIFLRRPDGSIRGYKGARLALIEV